MERVKRAHRSAERSHPQTTLARGLDRRHLRRGVSDFGYLEPDAKGRDAASSSSIGSRGKARTFGHVARHAPADGVYFQSEDGAVPVVERDHPRLGSGERGEPWVLAVNGKLDLTQPGVGLMELVGDMFLHIGGTASQWPPNRSA